MIAPTIAAAGAAAVDVAARWCAPWQSLYSDSKVLPVVVVGAHLLSLLFGGGLAVAADRATLRTLRASPAPDGNAARRALLAEVAAAHRPVVAALAVSAVSGALLAAADVQAFAASPVFWVKLALVALLLANGAALVRAEAGLRAGAPPAAEAAHWRRLRATAWASLALWTLTTVAGTALTGAA